MPETYRGNSDLPDRVQDSLPEHAQDIYREAFNSAYKQYDEPEERGGDRSREETAHAVAWAAVKRKYKRIEEGKWVAKQSEDEEDED
jgi:cation transport regulator